MSSRPGEALKNDEHLKEYTLKPIENAIPALTRPKSDFIPMQIEGQVDGVFTVFGMTGQDHQDEKSTEDYQNEIKKAAEKREREGYEKGFAQGEKDGFELGVQKSLKVLENMERLFESIHQLKTRMIKQHEKEILEIIFAIAEKITRVQLGLNQATVRETIINAIQTATEKNDIRLRINPDDFNYVEKLRPELFERFKSLKSILINADSSIERGGCLLETSCGDIDARIETQLEKISESIKSAFFENTDG